MPDYPADTERICRSCGRTVRANIDGIRVCWVCAWVSTREMAAAVDAVIQEKSHAKQDD